MPNNENNYRIKLEFASLLKGFPGFRIVACEAADFVYIRINHPKHQNSLAYLSTTSYRWPRYTHSIIKALFQELEKDLIDREELMCIGILLRKYLRLLKQIDTDHVYYTVTPGMMVGLFLVLHLCLLFFPANRTLIYGSLTADLYAVGFWIFSVWSFSQNEQNLTILENKLNEKIRFLKSLSSRILPLAECCLGFFKPTPPSYGDVVLEDAMRSVEGPTRPIITVLPNASNFFYPERNDSNNAADPREERCYSVQQEFRD